MEMSWEVLMACSFKKYFDHSNKSGGRVLSRYVVAET
jgi:hypothetical protein